MPSVRLGRGLYGDLEPSPAPASPLRGPTDTAAMRPRRDETCYYTRQGAMPEARRSRREAMAAHDFRHLCSVRRTYLIGRCAGSHCTPIAGPKLVRFTAYFAQQDVRSYHVSGLRTPATT